MRLSSQNVERAEQAREEQEREEQIKTFNMEVAKLFEGKKAKAYHVQNIPELYKNRELFWLSYWSNFVNKVVAQDANLVLELLSFWFDESFTELDQIPYVTQEFFLGLSETLVGLKKDRNFRETAREIYARVVKQGQQLYPWYRLVQEYFVEQEKGRLGFFRRN